MKNLIIILITALSFQFINAQNFIETNKYTITNKVKTKQQEYINTHLNIINTEGNSSKVTTFDIIDLDYFDDVNISVLSNPKLDNINEVIKIDINYNGCCPHVQSHYFMVTDTNSCIALPYIDNAYCENTVSEIQYIFPSQPLGKENIILKSIVNFTETNTIKESQTLQSFVWNDDDFDSNDEIDYQL